MKTKFLLKNWSSVSAAAAVLLGFSNRAASKPLQNDDTAKIGDGSPYEPLILKPSPTKLIPEERFATHVSHSSHASHASHASHYSGSGSYVAPAATASPASSAIATPASAYEVPTRIELASGTVIYGTNITKSAAGITFTGSDNKTHKVARNLLSNRTITELALPPEASVSTTPTSSSSSSEPSDIAALRKKNEELEQTNAALRAENAALKQHGSVSIPSATTSPRMPSAAIPNTYRIVGVRKGDYLSVRSGPGSTYSVIARLSANERGIKLGSNRINNGPTVWQEVVTDQYTGWVNAEHLAPDTGD
jgi:L-lactate utilization protein LutC